MSRIGKLLVPNVGTLIILGVFFLMQFTGVFGAPSNIQVADVPTKIGYQGQLVDSSGAPVPNDTYAMHFAMYSTSTCLLYTSPSPRDRTRTRMPSSA